MSYTDTSHYTYCSNVSLIEFNKLTCKTISNKMLIWYFTFRI